VNPLPATGVVLTVGVITRLPDLGCAQGDLACRSDTISFCSSFGVIRTSCYVAHVKGASALNSGRTMQSLPSFNQMTDNAVAGIKESVTLAIGSS